MKILKPVKEVDEWETGKVKNKPSTLNDISLEGGETSFNNPCLSEDRKELNSQKDTNMKLVEMSKISKQEAEATINDIPDLKSYEKQIEND
jgi:hypothetical protein